MTRPSRGLLQIHSQIRRFLLTGLINTAVHTCVAVTLIKALGAGPASANVVAFVTATLVSYLLNTLWSFGQPLSRVTLVRFITVAAVGATLTAVVAGVADSLGAHYLVGIACVALSVAPVTFILHKYWTYKP